MTILKINYRPDIDGLRALAVLAVVLHHLSASLVPGGYVGVDVFFVISGYLITSIISSEVDAGQFSFKRFYQRRVRRIFPALFVVLAVTMVTGYFFLLPSDYTITLRAVLGTLFFSSNIVFWKDMAAGYFAANSKLNPLLHTWSLGVEEQFYVVFPILLLLCHRYLRKYIFWVLLACALVSLAAAVLLINTKAVAVFFLSPFRGWELLAGSMLTYNALRLPCSRALREVLAIVGLSAILVACFVYDEFTIFPGWAAILPVLGAATIIHSGSSGATMVGRLLQWRPVAYIGLISYSLYLWHWPLIVLTHFAIGMDSLTPYLPILFVASLLLASLSYHFIEQPFRHSGTVTRKVVFTSAAIFSLVLASLSIVGLMKGGFANRFDATTIKLDQARTPLIPFVECDSRQVGHWCEIGSPTKSPTALVWGDSHALAWGPALDASLSGQNRRGIFAVSSVCPPLMQVENKYKPSCSEHNLSVLNYLSSHPEIRTVILSAFWSTYFRDESPLILNGGKRGYLKGAEASGNGLALTLHWLREHGKRVILLGPVPVYKKSVPLALALESIAGYKFAYSSATEQMNLNAPFFNAIQFINPTLFDFFNPIASMCVDKCVVMKDGFPLYRDSDHLSAVGAMALKSDIDLLFGNSDLEWNIRIHNQRQVSKQNGQ